MKWFETRLRFKNLKEDISLNSFLPTEIADIWVPELTFANTEERPSTVIDQKTSIAVQKLGSFKLSETYENENIQYFAGTDNPLHLERFYNQRFLCDYKLSWYPFDVQHCFLRMEMKKAYSPFTQLVVESYQYLGERFLTQYEVVDVVMEVKTNTENIQDRHASDVGRCFTIFYNVASSLEKVPTSAFSL